MGNLGDGLIAGERAGPGLLRGARPSSYARAPSRRLICVRGSSGELPHWVCGSASFGLLLVLPAAIAEIAAVRTGVDAMAQRTQVILVDDIDGSEATQTVTFGIDG